jgi:hypothetical protein
VIVPEPLSRRRICSLYRHASADELGHFGIGGVAPGSYLLLAFESIEDGSWFEEDFMARNQGMALRLDVQENGSVQLDFVIDTALRR